MLHLLLFVFDDKISLLLHLYFMWIRCIVVVFFTLTQGLSKMNCTSPICEYCHMSSKCKGKNIPWLQGKMRSCSISCNYLHRIAVSCFDHENNWIKLITCPAEYYTCAQQSCIHSDFWWNWLSFASGCRFKFCHKNAVVTTWPYKHLNIIITLIMVIFSELIPGWDTNFDECWSPQGKQAHNYLLPSTNPVCKIARKWE